MARLHIRYRNLHKGVRKAAQALFDSKAWQGTEEQRQTKFERFLREASRVYSIPVPTLTLNEECPTAIYDPNEQAIILNKYSVLSLFHCFRLHMQFMGATHVAFGERNDAQAWACSLFYTMRPALFRRRVREGRVVGVTERDLLSSATLAARQEEVDEVFSGLVAQGWGNSTVPTTALDGDSDDVDIFQDDPNSFEPEQDDENIPGTEGAGEAETALDAFIDSVPHTTVTTNAPAPVEDEPETVTIAEAAEALGKSQSTIRNMLNSGALTEHTTVLNGRSRRLVVKSSVEARLVSG